MAIDRRFKRGPTANVASALSGGTLQDGDPIFDTDADRLYIGKGASRTGPADHLVELSTVSGQSALTSFTTTDPPAAPEGAVGAKFTADGAVQKLQWSGAGWVSRGSPLTSKDTIQAMVKKLSASYGMTTQQFQDLGLQPRYMATLADFQGIPGTNADIAMRDMMAHAQTKGGLYAEVHPGTYELSGGVTVPHPTGAGNLASNLYMRGLGAVFTQAAGADFALGFGRYDAADPTGASALKYVTLEDIILQGRVLTDAFSEQKHLLNLNNVQNVTLIRPRVIGFQGDGIYIGSGIGVEMHNKNIRILHPYIDGLNNDNRNGISVIDVDGLLVVEPIIRNTTRSNMPGAIDIEPDGNPYHIIRNIEVQGGTYENIGGNAGVLGVFVPALAAEAGTLPYNIAFTGKPKFKNITNTAGAFQFVVQRAPDITVTTTAAAAAAATSLIVAALTAPLGIGAQLTFAGVTATLTASAAYGATTLTVSALTGAVASGVSASRTTPDMHLRVSGHDVQTANRLYTIDGVTDLQITGGTWSDVANTAQLSYYGLYGLRDVKLADRFTRAGTNTGEIFSAYGNIDGLDLRETLFDDCGVTGATGLFGLTLKAGAKVKRLKLSRTEIKNPNAKTIRLSFLEASRSISSVTYPDPAIDASSSETGNNVLAGATDPVGALIAAGSATPVIPKTNHPTGGDLNSSAFYANTFPGNISYTGFNFGTNAPGGATQGDLTTFIDPTYGADGVGFAWQEFRQRGPTGGTWIRFPSAITAGASWGPWRQRANTSDLASEADGLSASGQGYLAWSLDTRDATSSYAPASGNLMLGYGRATRSVAAGGTLNAKLFMNTAGSGLTEGRVAVYRASDGLLVASSANLSATLFSGSTGAMTVPLTVTTDINLLDYLYIGTLSVGTTTPAFAAPPAPSAVFNLLSLNRRALKGGQTSLPTTLTGFGGANQVPWVGLY